MLVWVYIYTPVNSIFSGKVKSIAFITCSSHAYWEYVTWKNVTFITDSSTWTNHLCGKYPLEWYDDDSKDISTAVPSTDDEMLDKHVT